MNIHDGVLTSECGEKYRHLKTILTGYGDLVLAFSGGADSAFLLAAAKAAGIGRVVAVTIQTQFFTQKERLRARALARELSAEHLFWEVDILGNPDVVKNDPRRCYYCKHHSFSLIKQWAEDQGGFCLVHGINVDDLGEYRPGIEAARALGFKSPLVEAGFTKQEIRRCAKALGLGIWDLPSQSCLATRIPTGDPLQAEQLRRVEKAEDLLEQMGLRQVRVRSHGNLARIEVPLGEFSKILEDDVREMVYTALIDLGFDFVSLDLAGYESGKMNMLKKRAEQE